MGVPHLMPSLGIIPWEYSDKPYLSRNEKDCPIPDAETARSYSIRLNKTSKRDGQTNGQTDTHGLAITAVCISGVARNLSRGEQITPAGSRVGSPVGVWGKAPRS